ncbi:MAG: hypothetical protein V1816_09055 [Pseudomonadota bacterium]
MSTENDQGLRHVLIGSCQEMLDNWKMRASAIVGISNDIHNKESKKTFSTMDVLCFSLEIRSRPRMAQPI